MKSIRCVLTIVLLLLSLVIVPQTSMASEEVLAEGEIDVSTTSTTTLVIPPNTVAQSTTSFAMRVDYDARTKDFVSWESHSNWRNKTGQPADSIPTIDQPCTLWANASYQVGTATMRITPTGEWFTVGVTYYCNATVTVYVDINQDWQESIAADTYIFVYDEKGYGSTDWDVLKTYFTYPFTPFPTSNVYIHTSPYIETAGLLFGFSNAASFRCFSDTVHNTNTIVALSDFYNAYEVKYYDIGLGSYYQLNISRNVTEAEDKLTQSRYVFLNESGETIVNGSWTTDTNTSYTFTEHPVMIFLGSRYMNPDGTDRYDLIYDNFGEYEFCDLRGYVINANNGTNLSGVTVYLDSNTDISSSSGVYDFPIVVTSSSPHTMAATQTGFATVNYSDIYLYEANTPYVIDIYMVPDDFSYSGVAVAGVVQTLPWHVPVANQVVNITNGSYNADTTTNNYGFYSFDNLDASDSNYSINTTLDGYRDFNVTITTPASGYVLQNVELDPNLELGVTARTTENVPIQEYSAIFNGTTLSTNASERLAFTNQSFGIYELTVTATGYYPYQQTLYLDSNTDIIAYMDLTSAAGYEYPAHYVALKVVNWFGRPITDVNVTIATGNITRTGFTGDDGVAGFLMNQDLYYNITLTSGTDIQRLSLMPVYTEYTIFFTPTDQVPPQDTKNWYDFVDFNISTQEINSTHAYINLTYVDILSASSNLYIFVNDSDDVNLINSSVNLSVIVNQSQGASFFVGFTCDYTGYDTLSVKKVVVFPWNLGEDSAISEYTRELAAIAFLILLGAVFGTLTVPHGGLLLPIFALILNWAGWFTIVNDTTTRMVCLTAITLALMFYMRSREDEVM